MVEKDIVKVNYTVHMSSPHIPILSWINRVHVHQSYFFKIHFNNTLPSTPRSSTWWCLAEQCLIPLFPPKKQKPGTATKEKPENSLNGFGN
jgi:hypothetical protein